MHIDRYFMICMMRVIAALAIVTFGLLIPTQGGVQAAEDATTLRVAVNGSDTTGCGPASAPCQSIQYAANKAVSGDTLLVAAGIYSYKASADTCSFLTTRAVVCFVDKHLTILGGYANGDWSSRDPYSNVTVIDGGNTRRGVAIIAFNSTASLHMEGFTIQNGLAQGATSGGDFYSFAFGGGIWAQNSSVALRDVTFRSNRAVGANLSGQYGGAGSGGGLAIQSTKNGVISTLENVVFDSNQAIGGSGSQRGGLAVGGGLYTYYSALSSTNVQFLNNRAQAGNSSGSGVDSTIGLHADAIGGGAGFQIGSTISLTDVFATGNQALGGNAGNASSARAGGAFGGGLEAEQSTLTIDGGTFTGNNVQGGRAAKGGMSFGGGLMTDTSNALLNSLKVVDNTAISGASSTGGLGGTPAGGGAYLTAFNRGTGYTASVVNSIFAGNLVQSDHPIENSGSGAGIVVQAMTVDIIHCTIANNYFTGSVFFGQAIMVNGANGESGTPGVANITNTIISNHLDPNNNSSAVTVARGSTATFNKGIFSGNTNNTNSNNKPSQPGTINGMSTMMQVASVGFVSPSAPQWNFHLSGNSPAIDHGVDIGIGIDIDNQARPFNNLPDIGADEYMDLPDMPFSVFIPLARR